MRIIKYIVGTQYLFLTLKADKQICLKWYVDATFMIASYFKLHTGKTGVIASVLRKQ